MYDYFRQLSMGKAAMCIRMLQILNTGRVYPVSALASLLNTNARNVIEYKKELNEVATECGYEFYIETVPGRYGGYQLSGSAILPSLMLSTKEKDSLYEAVQYLSSRNDFMKKDDFQLAIGKIISRIVINDIKREDNMTVINHYPLVMSQEDIKYRYDLLQSAIKDKRTVKFKYLTQKNVVKERVFDPYELFMYNNAYFVIGWLHSDNHSDIFSYKLNRIQSIEVTEKKFKVWSYYNRNEYLDEFGFKNNGEWIHVEFIAFNNYASLVRERIYGKNQVVEPLDEKSTKVSVDMQNKENIRVFILGFGENVTVLQPDWLKQDIKEQAQKIIDKYQ